jgi:hypothetical protein
MNKTERERPLRAALVFGGSVLEERTLESPRAFNLGSGPDALPLPHGVVDAAELAFLEPSATGGWQVVLHPSMRGAIWIDGERRSVGSLRARGSDRVALGATDYGVLTIGKAALFFQRSERAPALRGGLSIDGSSVSSFALSVFLHAAALLLLFLAQREAPRPGEADLPEDLIRRWLPVAPLVEAPDEIAGLEDGDETIAQAPSEGADGEASPERGDDAARAPRPSRVTTGRRPLEIGMLAAIHGRPGDRNALAALQEGPSLTGLLEGLRAGARRPGHGRGIGLRGSGEGRGPGLVGSGQMETNVGGEEHARLGLPSRREREEIEVRLPPPRRPSGPGFLPASAVHRVVLENRRAIQFCYESSANRRPDLRGTVQLHWRIDLSGRVQNARIARSTLRDPRAEGCMLRQLRRWSFPRPDGGFVDVDYPFVFEAHTR